MPGEPTGEIPQGRNIGNNLNQTVSHPETGGLASQPLITAEKKQTSSVASKPVQEKFPHEEKYKERFKNLSIEELEKALNDNVLEYQRRLKNNLPEDSENSFVFTALSTLLKEKFSKTLENLSLEELRQKLKEFRKQRELGQHSGISGEDMDLELIVAIEEKRYDVQAKKLNKIYQDYTSEQIKNKMGEIEELHARAVIDGTPIDHDVFLRFLYNLLDSKKNGKTQ